MDRRDVDAPKVFLSGVFSSDLMARDLGVYLLHQHDRRILHGLQFVIRHIR
jgi:hypothetical protein